MILICCPDWLPQGGQWHFPLESRKNRKVAGSGLLNRILLNRNTGVIKFNWTKIMLWTFLSTSEAKLLNCYNQTQGGPMRSFIVWSWGLYEVSLNYLWFRLPLEHRFSNSLLTRIFLPISLHFTTLYIQNNNITVTHNLCAISQGLPKWT